MKVINFGSMNIDKVYIVDHFVHPGETLAADRMEVCVGGKGLNQSVALVSAGVQVYHAGMVGCGDRVLRKYLQEKGVDTRFVRMAETDSGHTVIQVNRKGENGILLFPGANRCLTKEFVDEVLDCAQTEDIILLQNEVNQLEYIMTRAAEKNLRIAFNPSPVDDALLKLPLHNITWFVLNEIEGETLAGGKKNADEIIHEMYRRYPKSQIVLTLGGNGSCYYKDGRTYRQGIFKTPVIDTTAAGDTFTGYFIAGIINGETEQNCLKMAAKAAALTVSRAGAAQSIPARWEVEQSTLSDR